MDITSPGSRYMRYDANEPEWEERTRFVLSKGHAAPALYATLARAGFFPRDELKRFRTLGSPLEGHPSLNKKLGIELSTGLLGTGVAAAVGKALLGYDVIVLLGDGEYQEGIVKEALEFAVENRLGNYLAIIDNNDYSLDRQIPRNLRIADTCKGIGCHVIGKEWARYERDEPLTVDGHDFVSLGKALDEALDEKAHPTVIVANTIKGKGIPAAERDKEKRILYHGIPLEDNDYAETKTFYAKERERLGGWDYHALC
jgi:transketolase